MKNIELSQMHKEWTDDSAGRRRSNGISLSASVTSLYRERIRYRNVRDIELPPSKLFTMPLYDGAYARARAFAKQHHSMRDSRIYPITRNGL